MSTFNALNSLKQVVTQVSVVSVVAITGLALAHPAQAASLDLRTWNQFGDVQATTAAQAKLTNAYSDGLDDAVNRNLSGNNPLLAFQLESDLGLSSRTLDLLDTLAATLENSANEGSAIQTTFNNVRVGDRFSFNWSFDRVNPDRAFIAINNTIFNLTTNNPFSYAFTSAGNYRVAIGVVDVFEANDSSMLTVNNADFTAVPTPALLPGLIALGLRAAKRRRASH
jgi:hypothetical protein